MNISSLDGESLTGGVVDCKTYSKATSIVVDKVDEADGNNGGVGWHTCASIVYGCDGRGSADGRNVGASTKDAWNNKYVGGGR